MIDENPSATLAKQLQWALNHFLYSKGVITEKPSAEPPGFALPSTRKDKEETR